MKSVPLSKNKWTQDTHFLVSDDAYDLVKNFNWFVVKNDKEHLNISRHATQNEVAQGWPTKIKLHRYVLGLKKSDKTVVDHKNGWLDNTFESLRPTTVTNNNRYRGPLKRRDFYSESLPKGVYLTNSASTPYRAQICVSRKRIHLGCFDTIEAASIAYDKAALYYFGEFAKVGV